MHLYNWLTTCSLSNMHSLYKCITEQIDLRFCYEASSSQQFVIVAREGQIKLNITKEEFDHPKNAYSPTSTCTLNCKCRYLVNDLLATRSPSWSFNVLPFRWAFIDLTAGPFTWGPTVGGEGVRTERSLPSVDSSFGPHYVGFNGIA